MTQRPPFLDYLPQPLAFGTSGLRGLVSDITDLEAYINTKGFLQFALKCNDVIAGAFVSIAGDLRPSTERILGAVARAIRDAGLVVENAGRIPTPALTYHAMQNSRPCIMVTGSHIPFDRNGIKFCKSTGEVLKSDEPAILEEVSRVRLQEYSRPKGQTPFDSHGMFQDRAGTDLPYVNSEAERRYQRRYLDLFPADGLKDLQLVVFQHSAVGRDILVEILRGLGAEVSTAGRSESFVAIDTENVTADQLDRLDAMARDQLRSHNRISAILSTDGDSDRPLLAAVLPEGQTDGSGRIIQFYPGDLLGLAAAEFLKADAAAVAVSANDAVDLHTQTLGIKLLRTRIGSPHVIRSMAELDALGYGRIVAWEANGGFLTGTDLELYGQTLKALPTRDAVLPLLCALFQSRDLGCTIPAVFSRLPRRATHAGLLDNFPAERGRQMVARFAPSDPQLVEIDFNSDGFMGTDAMGKRQSYSAQQPLVQEMEQKRRDFAKFFSTRDGFGPVQRINSLDGLRVWFEGGDIVHIRPSGNAPQLRSYSNSDTPKRAEQIVRLCIAEPNGIFRQIEADIKGHRD